MPDDSLLTGRYLAASLPVRDMPIIMPAVVRAHEAAQYILADMATFAAKLDDAHEVAVALVPFGPQYLIHVRALSTRGEMLVVFHGETQEGDAVILVQHVHQLSFLLLAAKRANPDEPKKPIGFAPA